MMHLAATFAFFTVASASSSCAEDPSSPACAARARELLQTHAVKGIQLEASALGVFSRRLMELEGIGWIFCFADQESGP